jgi:carboxylesterase
MSNNMLNINDVCESVRLPGNKTGCLLLHGLTSSPYEMHYLADFLHRKNFTVYSPLLPGHGQSPKALKKTGWHHWYDAAKSELFTMRKKCTNVFVIGQSMGAMLALHLSAHYQVNGIVALSPALILRNRFAYFSRLIYKFYPYYKKTKGPDIKEDIKNITYKKIPVKAITQLLDLCSHVKDDLQDIYIPALIVYSKHDHVILPKSALMIYETLSSQDKRILALDKSYHVITLDVEKEIVFSEIHKFILRSI